MKVRVEIRQTILHSGEVEMSEERYKDIKNMPKMKFINTMMFIGLSREED